MSVSLSSALHSTFHRLTKVFSFGSSVSGTKSSCRVTSMVAGQERSTGPIAMVIETELLAAIHQAAVSAMVNKRKREAVDVNVDRVREDIVVRDEQTANILQRIAEQIVDVLLPQVLVEIVELVQLILQGRSAEEIVDVLVSQFQERIAEQALWPSLCQWSVKESRRRLSMSLSALSRTSRGSDCRSGQRDPEAAGARANCGAHP